MSTQHKDLQEFLDNFHKEIEEVNISTSSLEDKIQKDDSIETTNDDMSRATFIEQVGNTTYYLDDDGNCFMEEGPPTQKHESTSTKQSSKQVSADLKETVEDNDFVVVLDGNDTESASTSASVVYNFEEANENRSIIKNETCDGDDDDDDEDDDGDGDGDEDYVVSSKLLKLYPSGDIDDSQQLRCKDCNFVTDKKQTLIRHQRGHNDDKHFICSVCERAFKSNTGLINHINVHLGKKPHVCKECTKPFTTSGELMRHIRYKHTGERPHKCTECGYASVELSKLRRHIRCHTGERPYQCPHCTYASPDTFKLKRHLRTHTGEKPYECDICKARFTQANSLKSHKLIHSVVDKPVFQCTLCPTTCGRKADLRLHMHNLHQSDHPITCKRCGKDLPDRYSYKLHIKTHDGEKCYSCTLCSYKSISQHHLESHMLIHTDEKPFSCEFCDQKFRQRQLLKRHFNMYHNKNYTPPEPTQKMHNCPECKRTFVHKGNLMRHMEVHDPSFNTGQTTRQLKKGRNLRVKNDGTVFSVESEEDNNENYDEIEEPDYDFDEIIEEVNVQIDPILKSPIKMKSNEKNVTTFTIKKEPKVDEQISVQVDGEEHYMVLEVVSDDGEEFEEANEGEIPKSNEQRIILKTETVTGDDKLNDANYFGYEVNDNNQELDEEHDAESQEFIQLMNIMSEV